MHISQNFIVQTKIKKKNIFADLTNNFSRRVPFYCLSTFKCEK